MRKIINDNICSFHFIYFNFFAQLINLNLLGSRRDALTVSKENTNEFPLSIWNVCFCVFIIIKEIFFIII